MFTILAIDALEYTKVLEYDTPHLLQTYYGKTDLTEFSEPRTMVLWSSFMTGKNREKEILAKGDAEMWNTRTPLEETFFNDFKDPRIIDLPGYSYDLDQHAAERKLLKSFFETDDEALKSSIKKGYNSHAFEHHRKVKEEFLSALEGDHELVLGYFSIADVIGHLNFGNKTMMKMIYKDLDEIASRIKTPYLVLSDHGMTPIGMFGDHSNYGFWSTGSKDLGTPRITDLANLVNELSV